MRKEDATIICFKLVSILKEPFFDFPNSILASRHQIFPGQTWVQG
jgi:hypothetical protein